MKTRAAVAFEAGKPLEIVEVDLEGPKAGEVLVEIKATGICHTDEFTLSGADPEGAFPAILGHEGAGIVQEVGPGVTSLKPGDHVIPLYTPECRECEYCLNPKTNLCQAIRTTQGAGVMPDGTSRFSYKGEKVLHYMGCSTFSNHTVLPEIALAKVNKSAPFENICYIGCGVTTGIGAVINTAKVEEGSNCVVFGLGGIGLNVIQGCRLAGADKIVGVDLNPDWAATLKDADAVAIMAGHDAFRGIGVADFTAHLAPGALIFDGRIYYDREMITAIEAAGFAYAGVGRQTENSPGGPDTAMDLTRKAS